MATKPYAMTRKQAAEGIALCLDKVAHALDGAEIVCQHGGDETVAVYLYTAAIEELGKALLLNDLFAKSEAGVLEVPRQWFGGRGAHGAKFERAHAILPDEAVAYQEADVCYDQEKIPRDHADLLEDGKRALEKRHDAEPDLCRLRGTTPPERRGDRVITRDYDKDAGTLTIRVSTPLAYEAGKVFVTVPYDFATRKNMLYADWDDRKKRWNGDATIGLTRFVPDDNDSRRSVEVEKDEEETYPDAVLGAISAFREAAAALEWASGARFGG